MLRTRVLTSLVAPFATIVIVALPACGSSGGGTSNVLSKGEFARQANALCAKAETERAQLIQQLSPSPSGPADAETLRSVASTDRELLRRVDALVPPEAEQDRVDRVLKAWRQRADLESEYATAVGAMQDSQTLASFTADVAQIDASAAPVAKELGLTECTRGAS